MNKKICELLTILINSPNQHFRYEELARLLSVSTRSIRNYVQDISYFLTDQNITRVVNMTNKGITFIGDTSEGEWLASHLIDTEFYFYRLSSEERAGIITLKLLLSAEPCTLSALTEQFNASRVTIIKDMEQVRLLITRYNMTFDASTNHGYLLVAQEKDRRELISRIVLSSTDAYHIYNSKINLYEFYMNEECFKEPFYSELKEILNQAEDRYKISVSDAYFEKILFELKLMTSRVKKGFSLVQGEDEIFPMKKLNACQVAEFILKEVSRQQEIRFSESETVYFAYKLYENHFYNAKVIEDTRCMQTHMVLTSFLDKIGRELMLPLAEDNQLIEQLSTHLSNMKKAHSIGSFVQNDFKDQIVKEYDTYSQLIQKYCSLLEEHFGYRFCEDDIAYIILYIVVSIERYFEEDTIPRVIVVCHTGIGTANFLVEELKSNFNIKVLTATSSHKLADTMKQFDYDLIISTISLPNTVGSWIKVTPMLEDNDILALQRILFSIKRDKRKDILSKMQTGKKKEIVSVRDIQRLEQVLTSEHIQLEVCCRDWREAIRSAAGILLKSGSIKPQYIQAIEESVISNGAYFVFCPGIALAHAGPGDGVVRFDISMIRLRDPVCFGHKNNDPVQYIICFGSTEAPEDTKLILKLMNMISSPDLQLQLASDKEIESFYSHLIKYGGSSE